jgi:hypothetical protein
MSYRSGPIDLPLYVLIDLPLVDWKLERTITIRKKGLLNSIQYLFRVVTALSIVQEILYQ